MKIGKALVDSVRGPKGKGYSIVTNIAHLAKDLNISMLARMWKIKHSCRRTSKMGVMRLQKYHYDKPRPAEELEAMSRR